MPIRLPKQTVEAWIRRCEEAHAFVSIDGQRAHSIKDLVKILEKMTTESYGYHVTNEKNDFANWVQGVFHNGHLSANFRSARSRKESFQYAKRHQAMLERNMRDFGMREEMKRMKANVVSS